ncbi:hypothetical protein CTRU02_214899 [Colletotrichum truncatum]|uniref:Uncharacterized protein n=1 Tax=Colletotrichum truncatum TaxID=5467 RepID=A0ACC3YE17_COLTU
MGERTGSRVFQWVWSYVLILLERKFIRGCPGGKAFGPHTNFFPHA